MILLKHVIYIFYLANSKQKLKDLFLLLFTRESSEQLE